MTCQLITGRRNSSRTRVLYEKLFQALENRRVYLILPEQATFQHELYMEKMRGERSLWNLEITSFRRLAQHYVMGNPMDALGRELLIYDILSGHKEEFVSLKPRDIRGGFVEDIGSVLKEISMNALSAAFLREKAAEADRDLSAGDLGDKLRDLALVQSELEERNIPDESGSLVSFADLIREKRLFSDAVFCFDDFFDFTAVEYDLISALMEAGASLHFAFLCDREDGTFAKTSAAVSRLIALAERHDVLLELTPLPAPEEPTSLGFLERRFFRRDGSIYNGRDCDVTLVEAENRRAEIRYMAQTICGLAEQGYDLNDIGICFRSIAGYEKLIEDLMSSYGIPCFVDQPYSLLHHPVFRFGLGLFRIVAEKWSFASVFSLLKSGLFPMEEHDCDVLENYCLAHGIKGRRFYQEEDWAYRDEREKEDVSLVNEIRRRVLSVLGPATEEIKKKDTALHYSRTFWTFLEKCRCDVTVNRWRKEEEGRGRVKKSAELAAGIGALGEMLEQLTAAFPERVFTLNEYMELLKMGASSVTVRTIPPELDAVEISILGQSRPSRKKVVFLGGANEGVFPAAVSDGGFLNIDDRSRLKAYTDRWVQDKTFYYEAEDILAYQGFTLAKEKLIVSYSSAGEEGKAYPSPFVPLLEKAFPMMKKTSVRDELDGDGFFYSLDEVLGALPLSLRENEVSGWEEVKETLLKDPASAERAETLLSSLSYTGQSKFLSGESLKHYPGKELTLSVSSLELFRRCPFSYFARYGLGLKERKILQFAAPDLGNIFHEILCELMESMKEQQFSWNRIGEVEEETISEMVAEKLSALSGENLFPEEHLAYISLLLGENLRFVLDMMVMQAESGDCFVPVLWEVPFGGDGVLPSYDISVDEKQRKIHLNGIIDRVDMAEKEGQRYLRIVDYKSSGKDLSMDDLYYGISLQLPVYMMVLDQEKERSQARPAGIFYQSLKDVMVRDRQSISDDKVKEKLKDEMALKGYIIGDGVSEQCYADSKKARVLSVPEYEMVQSYTEYKIKGIGQDIFRGRTEIRPYLHDHFSSCQFCPYGAVCGYEPELAGKEDRLPSINDAAAKSLMREEDKQ